MRHYCVLESPRKHSSRSPPILTWLTAGLTDSKDSKSLGPCSVKFDAPRTSLVRYLACQKGDCRAANTSSGLQQYNNSILWSNHCDSEAKRNLFGQKHVITVSVLVYTYIQGFVWSKARHHYVCASVHLYTGSSASG